MRKPSQKQKLLWLPGTRRASIFGVGHPCFKLQIGQNLVFAHFLWFQVQPAATLSFSFFFRGVHSRHVAALHWVGPMPEIHRAFAMRSKSRAASGTTKMSADEVG